MSETDLETKWCECLASFGSHKDLIDEGMKHTHKNNNVFCAPIAVLYHA